MSYETDPTERDEELSQFENGQYPCDCDICQSGADCGGSIMTQQDIDQWGKQYERPI